VGLLDLRLTRFFGWSRSRLRDDGRLFLQTLSVPEALLHDDAYRSVYDRVTESAPWVGFSTLPQLVRCADRFFTVEQVLDHSADLPATYAYWRGNINSRLHELRPLMGTDVLVYVRRQLDTMIWLAETGLLRLYRVAYRAKVAPRVLP
jgi:cyclopropane fatty-acyl-phospholipid synthase-like methyltransferase